MLREALATIGVLGIGCLIEGGLSYLAMMINLKKYKGEQK
jgi:hypothetical protein